MGALSPTLISCARTLSLTPLLHCHTNRNYSAGVQVKLVGAMHYNPASIEVAVNEINKLYDEGKLGTIGESTSSCVHKPFFHVDVLTKDSHRKLRATLEQHAGESSYQGGTPF